MVMKPHFITYSLQRLGQPTQVSVKSFHDIPRADFEIVLPEQKSITRGLDLLKLLSAVVVAVGAVAAKVEGE